MGRCLRPLFSSIVRRRALSTAPPPPLIAPANDQRVKYVRCIQCTEGANRAAAVLCQPLRQLLLRACQREHWASGFPTSATTSNGTRPPTCASRCRTTLSGFARQWITVAI